MAKTLVYLHGFLSSPKSAKAVESKAWFAEHFPSVNFVCPALSSYPRIAKQQLHEIVAQHKSDELFVIGSSLGGFWATYLIENTWAEKAVLVNPAVNPQSRFHEHVGKELNYFYSEEILRLTDEDLVELTSADHPHITFPEKYWLMVQTEDETLDYRMAVEKYHASEKLIEEGGNHSFEGYERWLPKIAEFFELID
ncbi:hypothetical protein TDB9533_02970 [Thalassocella blandensis]|nr:hypothetical protein TDB9533_02970 [Thalassocella blandensis]